MRTLAAILLAAVTGAASAQTYPDRPIRLFSPFPPGSPVDTFTRQVGAELQKSWGQPLVIENRPGANGIISADSCRKGGNDAYTYCLFDRTVPLLPYLYDKLPFDVMRDFEPVSNMVYTVLALVVHPSVGANSFRELIAAARAKPGTLNYGSLGPATTASLLMGWLAKQENLQMTHVIYKGPPDLFRALLSGETHITYLGVGGFLGFHKAGKLRVIGVSGDKRSPLVPEVASLAEQGLTGIDTRVWFGLFAPAGAPKDRTGRVHVELKRIFAIAAFNEKNLVAAGFEPIANSPDEFARDLVADRASGAELIRLSGARVE
jgi:tripartite-type tricarboxylate transporter receptor subunit TctC